MTVNLLKGFTNYCGEGHCICYDELGIVDCSHQSLKRLPIFDYWTMETVKYLYLQDNSITDVKINETTWISLTDINVRNNLINCEFG